MGGFLSAFDDWRRGDTTHAQNVARRKKWADINAEKRMNALNKLHQNEILAKQQQVENSYNRDLEMLNTQASVANAGYFDTGMDWYNVGFTGNQELSQNVQVVQTEDIDLDGLRNTAQNNFDYFSAGSGYGSMNNVK